MALLLLSGCASAPPKIGGAPGLTVISAASLPAPDRLDLTAPERPYYVGPNDKLLIDVYGFETLTDREIQVDSGGRFAFPLAGEIAAGGRTLAEIQQELIDRLRAAHVRSPQVSVNLKEAVSQIFTVEGQVRKPGNYPVAGRMTLLRALAKAEGTDEFTRLDDIVIYRTVKGERLAALYNLDAIRHGAYPDPEIYSNDVVMVGDDRARRLFKDIMALTPALLTPIIVAVDRLGN